MLVFNGSALSHAAQHIVLTSAVRGGIRTQAPSSARPIPSGLLLVLTIWPCLFSCPECPFSRITDSSS